MGNRYILYVTCPVCGFEDQEAYYAPTCGFLDWVCPTCDHKVDLEKLTGITYEDASNANLIAEAVKATPTLEGKQKTIKIKEVKNYETFLK